MEWWCSYQLTDICINDQCSCAQSHHKVFGAAILFFRTQCQGQKPSWVRILLRTQIPTLSTHLCDPRWVWYTFHFHPGKLCTKCVVLEPTYTKKKYQHYWRLRCKKWWTMQKILTYRSLTLLCHCRLSPLQDEARWSVCYWWQQQS